MSRFTPRYNKKVMMVSRLLKRKTYISAVEGLKVVRGCSILFKKRNSFFETLINLSKNDIYEYLDTYILQEY